MNEIEKKGGNLPARKPTELTLLNSRELPRLRNMEHRTREHILLKALSRAASVLGMKVETSDRMAIVEEIDMIIIEGTDPRLKFVTTGHIQLAFKNGMAGKYGEIYRLNLPTIIKWIETVRKDEATAISKGVKQAEKESKRNLQGKFVSLKEALPNGLDFGKVPEYKFQATFAKAVKNNLETKPKEDDKAGN